jgi:radical SAM protein with 4Fe4S-binding SPASM domain
MSYRELKEENSRRLRRDIAERRTVFEGLPEIVNFQHSSVCNLRCVMCYQAYKPGRRTIPLDRSLEILDEVLPTARKLKLTTAGEPIIGPFDRFVAKAREYECKLELITNATRLTPERFALMEDILDQIVVSLDSHEEEALDKVRGRGVHRRIMRNFESLGKYLEGRPKGYIFAYHMVLMKTTAPTLPGFVEFARHTGADLVKVLRMHYITPQLRDEECPFHAMPREELDRHVQEAQRKAHDLGVNLVLDEVGYENVWSTPVRATYPGDIPTDACRMMMQEVYIQPNQAIWPCCIPGDLEMGSIRRKAFREVWNGRPYRRLRAQMFSRKLVGPCARCKLYNARNDDEAYDFLPGSRTLRGFKRMAFLRRLVDRYRGPVSD